MGHVLLRSLPPLARGLGWLGLAGFIGVNGIACLQSHAMTHYISSGQRTPQPEALSKLDKVKIILTGVQLPRPENKTTPKESLGLRYETHRIMLSASESLEAWHIPPPSAAELQPAESAMVLLFHPYGGSKAGLLDVAEAFHQLGYGVVMVDFRGSGGSTGDRVTVGIQEAKDVAATSAYVAQQWPDQPQIFYGASMGAAAVMRALARREQAEAPRFAFHSPQAVIIESPFMSLRSTVAHRFRGMGLPVSPGSELMVLWGSLHLGSNGFAHRPVEYAQAIEAPVLLFHGEDDLRVTVEEAEAIATNLPNLHQISILPGNGHGGLVRSSGPQWKQSIQSFLQTAPMAPIP